MMDGRVTGTIRFQLDEEGHSGVPILAYSGQVRLPPSPAPSATPPSQRPSSAIGAATRWTLQTPPKRCARRQLDLEQGADMVMVKPATPYLDVVRRVKQETGAPLAAYHVSGEYSMLKAAAASGWIDERAAVLETLTSIRRAGADAIVTYYAKEAAAWLR